MAEMATDSFESSVEAFISSSEWLSDAHAPAVMALRAMAQVLDGGDLAPALLGQFGLTFRALAKQAPSGPVEVDPVDEAIAGMRGE